MSNNTELIDKESLDKIVADIKAILKRTSLDALNSVQWEFNQRYLFGNEVEKPLIKSGKLFTKEGPVAKGAIWTSLDTGKLWMNTGSGWKNIGGLNNINKPDLIEIFHPRTDYPVEEPVTRSNVSADNFIQMKFKKYEKYSVTKTQCPFSGFFVGSYDRTDIVQDVRSVFSSGPGTYEFICMVDDAKYFYFTTGSSSNVLESFTLTDLGSAIEPIKLTNVTASDTYVTFPIEKGKRYYYTKTAISFFIGYGKGTKDQNHVLKGCNNSGDSGAGSWSFVADEDADWIRIYTGSNGTLESFELRSEDLPDYELTYPYVTRSANDKPENPKVGDMIFDAYQAGTSGSPLWWNGTNWVDAKASVSTLDTTDAPTTANNGTIYYDTTEQALKIWINGGWQNVILPNYQSVFTPSTITGITPVLGMLRCNSEDFYNQLQVYNGSAWRTVYATAMSVFPRTAWSYATDNQLGTENGRFKFAYGGIKHILAYLEETHIAQVVTFTDYSGETIAANDVDKIVVTAAFGANSILDFTNIEKVDGKTIEITILSGSIIRVKDGVTGQDLNGCNESVVKCICLNNQWTFFKTSGITQITSAQ